MGELRSINNVLDIQWELVVSISGEIILILFHNRPVDYDIMEEENISIIGSSSCGVWNIDVPQLQINNINVRSNSDTSINCLPREIWLRNSQCSSLDRIEGLMSNFNFFGNEFTQYGTQRRCDTIRLNVFNKEVVFRTNEHIRLIIEQIRSQRIDRALMSSIHIPYQFGDTDDNINQQLTSISWFISLIHLKSCMCPIVRYLSRDDLVQIHIMNLNSSPFQNNALIDNLHVHNGILNLFNSSFESFNILDNAIELRNFFSILLGMYEGKYIEIKIACLLLAYEYFLTRYLTHLGEQRETILDLSIQDKLRRLNYHMRFINARLLGDNMRENVRNPLFHTGEIIVLNFDERLDFFNEYFDLLVQIVFRALGYSGGYISPLDHSVHTIQ